MTQLSETPTACERRDHAPLAHANEPDSVAGRPGAAEQPSCPNCSAIGSEGEGFCTSCVTPLDVFATPTLDKELRPRTVGGQTVRRCQGGSSAAPSASGSLQRVRCLCLGSSRPSCFLRRPGISRPRRNVRLKQASARHARSWRQRKDDSGNRRPCWHASR